MNTLATKTAAPSPETLFRKLISAAIACLLLAVSIGVLAYVTSRDHIANGDFIEYWAAGQLLVHGANPYDPNRISAMEVSAGRHREPALLYNPPLAVFLTLPLGVVRPRVGYVLWSLFILGAWLGSVHLLWIMNGRSRNALHFIGFFFTPALECFLLGQMVAFALLGITLFLYLYRKRPLFAGAALVLCLLKPHLFLPFWVVLLAWSVTRRAYRVVCGAGVSLAICCAVPLFFDPSIYSQYVAMAHISGVTHLFLPTLGALLRFTVDPNAFWIQFLPAFIGCLWGFRYFYRRYETWDWYAHGSLLILVSFLVAPYAWFADAIILLPSIFYAAYRARPGALAGLVLLLAANGTQLLLLLTPLQSAAHPWATGPWLVWYLWPTVGWLVWYLWTMRGNPSFMTVDAFRASHAGMVRPE